MKGGDEMSRKLTPGKLVIASHNDGKIREINDLVEPYGLEAISAATFGLPSPPETETTFEGNARIKAHAAARGANLPALADDSGLAIAALGGNPGVYSADWAGEPRDFSLAMSKVETALNNTNSHDKSAQFICCLCIAWPDGHDEVFLGTVNGVISFPPRGNKGFGYDPIFIADGMVQTFAEIDPKEKHAMSHRADAFNKLINTCLKT